MYPKLGRRRKTGDGRPYAYVCRTKERSQRQACAADNARGEELDAALTELTGSLKEDKECFLSLLRQGRRFCLSGESGVQIRLSAAKREREEIERKQRGLADSLAMFQEQEAKEEAVRHMEELGRRRRELDGEIWHLKTILYREILSDSEIREKGRSLSELAGIMGVMAAEQKRAVLNALIQRIIWDGNTAYVILKGVSDEELCQYERLEAHPPVCPADALGGG